MARIGIHGRIEGTSKYDGATVAILAWIFNSLENFANGQIDSTNLQDGAVTASKIPDLSITAAKLAPSSVTSAKVDSTVAKIATNQYTGDGTVSREIAPGFRARFVVIVNHTTRAIFIAWGGTASSFARVQIDSSGNITDGGTDFTGTSTNGFTLGSAAGGGNSNTNLVVYSYIALG